MRAALVLALVILAGGISAQALTVTPTTVDYEWYGTCVGKPTIIRPVLQATGGSGNYSWTALTTPPANLILNTDGTFSGDIDHSVAGPSPWTFDVEVFDTTSMATAQATITMSYSAAGPACSGNEEGGAGCASGTYPGVLALLVLAALVLCARLKTDTRKVHRSRGA